MSDNLVDRVVEMEPCSRDTAEPKKVAGRGIVKGGLVLLGGRLVGAAMHAVGFAFEFYDRAPWTTRSSIAIAKGASPR